MGVWYSVFSAWACIFDGIALPFPVGITEAGGGARAYDFVQSHHALGTSVSRGSVQKKLEFQQKVPPNVQVSKKNRKCFELDKQSFLFFIFQNITGLTLQCSTDRL